MRWDKTERRTKGRRRKTFLWSHATSHRERGGIYPSSCFTLYVGRCTMTLCLSLCMYIPLLTERDVLPFLPSFLPFYPLLFPLYMNYFFFSFIHPSLYSFYTEMIKSQVQILCLFPTLQMFKHLLFPRHPFSDSV